MDRGAWRATVHTAAETPTQLSTHVVTKTCLKRRECMRLCTEWEFTGRENCCTWNHICFDFGPFDFSSSWFFGSETLPWVLSCSWSSLFTRVRPLAPAWTAARQASLSFTVSQDSLRLMSVESGMPSSRLSLCLPLLLPSGFNLTLRCYNRADFTLKSMHVQMQ